MQPQFLETNFTCKIIISEARGSHSHTKGVRMLVIKNGVKGSIFGLVASSTFLENRVLFRLSFDI